VHEKLEILSFWPLTTVVNDDRAALSVIVKVKDRATERSADYLAAHFLRFRDDRIIEYCAIIDSLDAARQLAGQETAVQDS
jgi:ketosteroid isomerase-like protein